METVTLTFIEGHSPLMWRVDGEGGCLGFISSRPPFDHGTRNQGGAVCFSTIPGVLIDASQMREIAAKVDEMNAAKTAKDLTPAGGGRPHRGQEQGGAERDQTVTKENHKLEEGDHVVYIAIFFGNSVAHSFIGRVEMVTNAGYAVRFDNAKSTLPMYGTMTMDGLHLLNVPVSEPWDECTDRTRETHPLPRLEKVRKL